MDRKYLEELYQITLGFPQCTSCDVHVPTYHGFCIGCGHPNTHFDPIVFDEKYGMTIEKMRETCSTDHIATVNLIGIEAFESFPFCEFCGINILNMLATL